ncbi:MAG: hypothetical protein QF404_15570 [Planctomycetota bacterium]|nr:hypothetical protein [Planctomycetota bacterium]MDP6939957.1 hypothetical protein [Planctomycetota bacterium]
MSALTHVRLLILASLPALLVPRGVEMGWCLCPPVVLEHASPCCLMEQDEGDGGNEGLGGKGCDESDCPSCHDVDIPDFEEFLDTKPAPQTHDATPRFTSLFQDEVFRMVGRTNKSCVRPPPLGVTPAGLLPGTAPMRN